MPDARLRTPTVVRLFFLIRSLDRGGAQRQLIELVKGLDPQKFEITVCTFYDEGSHWQDLDALPAVKQLSLAKRGRWDVFPFLARLHRVIAASRPDIVHGYMPVANELALLMARRFGAKCIWGLRASNMDLTHYGALARRAFETGAVVSRFADSIIVNSEAGRAHYGAHGYCVERMTVVPNGIDCGRFQPDAEARERVRAEWAVPAGARVVGLVARLDPMKDHENFLNAAVAVAKSCPSVHFVCVGDGSGPYTQQMHARGKELGLAIAWLGDREDMCALYNAIDIVVLASAFGEGFPNVVGEAMACGKPCAVTTVGDAAALVGETGASVPPRQPNSLAAAIVTLLGLSDAELAARGAAARERIQENFSVSRLIQATIAIFADVLKRDLH